MANTKSGGKLLLYGLILSVLLFRLVEIVASSSGLFLKLEFAGLLLLLLLTFFAFAGYSRGYGERLIFFVFLLYIANLLLLWHRCDSVDNQFLLFLGLALVGLLMSFPKKGKSKKSNKVTKSEMTEPLPKVEIVHEEPKTVKEKTAENKPKVKHSPGKYVASKRSNIYHEPKCDWAKKIKKDRQLWFLEKKDAQKKGYRKHSCVN